MTDTSTLSGYLLDYYTALAENMPNQCWIVERTDGDSKGKRMIVNERALVTNLDK